MNKARLFLVALCLQGFILTITAQEARPLEGRWDLVITQGEKELPSWLEIRHSGVHTLVGRFVFADGSARPISEVKEKDGAFSFSIPPQWEDSDIPLEFKGNIEGDGLKGSLKYVDGNTYSWVAMRAPKLPYNKNPKWGEAVQLFNGADLAGWHTSPGENQWVVEDGILKSPKAGVNLVSDAVYTDFKLHAEFRYPEGANSGIYLRGRYEVQITDSKGEDPTDVLFGGVYGFLEPNEMAAKAAGEWQTYDITLIGSRVTIVANGATIINDQVIPGITGGAIDSMEGEPGPIFIQGDHGVVEFKKFVITPIAN